MKFITPILFVAAAATTYASTLNNFLKRDTINPDNISSLGLPEACQNEIKNAKETNDCTIYIPSEETVDDVCKKLQSDSCKNFYESPMEIYPSCKGTEVEDYFKPEILKSNIATVDFVCTKDEAGNLCPLVKTYINGGGADENSMEATCLSKKCLETATVMYSTSFGGLANKAKTKPKGKNGKQFVRDFLLSDECVKNSDATTLKYGSALLVTFAIFLYSLY